MLSVVAVHFIYFLIESIKFKAFIVEKTQTGSVCSVLAGGRKLRDLLNGRRAVFKSDKVSARILSTNSHSVLYHGY